MIAAIQPEETVSSFVERNIFINGKQFSAEPFRKFPKYGPSQSDISTIAEMLDWKGCHGFNKILHSHTNYSFRAVFKNIQDISYSGSEYIALAYKLYSDPSGFCPVCVAEDIECLGFSFWRRSHCSQLTVCAVHNVNLIKRCPTCHKQFSHGEHDLGVMWETCGGRHLKDSPVTFNNDAYELKKAQIFTDILSSTHHLSTEAVCTVLKEKIHQHGIFEQKIWNSISERRLGDEIELRLKAAKNARSFNMFYPGDSPFDIYQAIVETYEKFSDFISDVKAFGDEIRPIESLWSTYLAGRQDSIHFVEEDYEHGVGIWSCPFPAKIRYGMWDWRPVYYPCCNFQRPKRKGKQPEPALVERAPPGIYKR